MSKQGTWTDEQWQAITDRNHNLLVAAAAGAGKTAVLVERIIKRITEEDDPVDIDRLLVVTFTNASAAEMRARISARLVQALNQTPYSKHLRRQLSLINKAHITTLHSFCLELVRQNYFRLELDPNFRIADETETTLLKLEVLEEVLEDWYGREDNGNFLALVDCYGGEKSDQLLQDLILRLYDFAQSQLLPDRWLREAADRFVISAGTEFDDLIWVKGLKESIKLELQRAQSLLKRALKCCSAPGGPVAYREQLQNDLLQLQDLIKSCAKSWSAIAEAFQSVCFGRLKACRGEVDEELKTQASEQRKKAKEIIESLQKSFFGRTSQELLQDLAAVATHMTTLSQVTLDFQEKYAQLKRQRALVDFNDLEHYSLSLLAIDLASEKFMPSEIALALREQFVEVMVDEYQDINLVQETILQLVSRQGSLKPNLFMVGDMKQSIYRFRLAEPALFLAKYQAYGLEHEPETLRIDLSKNFRSRKEIIQGTNFIFKQIMSSQLGEMAYDEKAELVAGALYPEDEINRAIELCLIDQKAAEQPEVEEANEQEDLSKVQVEARLVGQKILDLVSSGSVFKVYDKNSNNLRPATFRDIVVLLRSTREQANIYLEEFRLLGIPAYADVGSGYLAAVEVNTFLALLKIIDNPQQDIPLAAVLRSPIVGLSAEELAEIRVSSPKSNFYEAVKVKAADVDELGQKLRVFLSRLDSWRTLARRDTLANLIWTLYRETGYFDYVGGMPNGRGRQANLLALHDRACQYEKTSFRGLFRFLRFIEKLEDSGSDLGMARALGENENVVRIMSIHKSKGLEFPIVFVAGLGNKFNMQDLNRNLLLHKDLGFGPDFVDAETRIVYPTVAKLALKHQIKMETLAEELRVLYVAMTRAKERLFLIGSVNDLEKQAKNWAALADSEGWLLPVHALADAKNFLDWICPAVIRHQAAEELRKLAKWEGNFPGEVANHPSSWQISFYDKNGVQLTSAKEDSNETRWQQVRKLEKVEVPEVYQQFIEGRLNWRYPYRDMTILPAKLAVSEIKERFAPRLLERPQFLQEHTALSGAEKGSALHTVLQHLNLRKNYGLVELEELVMDLVKREILTEEQAEVIDSRQIATFLTSDLGVRLRKAKEIYQEMPFSFALNVKELYEDVETAKETILVQGVIDVLFEEEDGLVLLDYKTDYTEEDTVRTLIETYRVQLDLYAKAVQKILSQPVKEKILYSFSLQKALKVS